MAVIGRMLLSLSGRNTNLDAEAYPPVGASLLAIAVYLSHQRWLTHCYREQARSHRDIESIGNKKRSV
ncbi:hypothetical protein EMIT043CA1_240085 [Pseudomonas brassicacearum]